jgi:hypothetical protein
MAKTKLHKLHKIKIHHNRWLIWAIAYLLFVGIAMLGYLKIANLDLENSENNYIPMHSYSDARLGFAMRYPADWSIEASNTSIAFLPAGSSDAGVTVSVLNTTAESSLRKSLQIKKESKITLDNRQSTKIINDLGQGHTETVILTNYNNKLYVFRGSDDLVSKLGLTFYFIE